MENDFNLEDREKFRIDPHVWLRTLLAIAGDKDKKREVVLAVSKRTGVSPEKAEVIFTTTIRLLLNETHLN